MDSVINWTAQSTGEVFIVLIVTVIHYYLGVTVLSRVVRSAVEAGMKRHEYHRKDIEKRTNTLSDLFKNIWRVLIITISALILFSKLFPGVSLAPLFASAGIIGVALGFGAQS